MRVYHLLALLLLGAAGPASAFLVAAVAASRRVPQEQLRSRYKRQAHFIMTFTQKKNDVGVRCNRARSSVSSAARAGAQPACTSAESKVAPVCEPQAMNTLGKWKSAIVLTDHIALEVGFSKQAYQAQCMTVDCVGGQEKFVHLKKKSTWFLAAVGGPKTNRSGLPAVTVVDTLNDKIFGPSDKQVDWQDADRGRGERGEIEQEVTEDQQIPDDPMLLLGACAPVSKLETPQKSKRARTAKSATDGSGSGIFDSSRAIDMPKRPSCAGSESAQIQTVHLHVRRQSRALWIRLDCIDWLVSYAADEHYFQGVSRSDPLTAVAANDYELEFDYSTRAWNCKINVGIDNGATLRMGPMQLTKEMYEKVAESDPSILDNVFWSKANGSHKRKASHAYLRLWALAAVAGDRQSFEDDLCLQTPKKSRIAYRAHHELIMESQAAHHELIKESQESHAADVGQESQESLAAGATSL